MFALLFVFSVLLFTACPFNLCLIWTVLKNRQLRTITNIFITSLAVCDFLLTLLIVPFEILYYSLGLMKIEEMLCVFHQCVQAFIPLVSVAHLLVITVDRYVKIVHPLKYPYIATRSRVSCTVVAIWILPLMVASVPLVGWNNLGTRNNTKYTDITLGSTGCDHFETLPCGYKAISFSFVLFTIIVMTSVYMRIYSIALHHTRRIEALAISQGNLAANDFKVIVVLLVTMGFFSVSWLPLVSAVLYRCINGSDPDGGWWSVAFIIAYTNSTLNPLIYGIGNREIRESFVRSWWRMCARRNQVSPHQGAGLSTAVHDSVQAVSVNGVQHNDAADHNRIDSFEV